MKAISVLEIHKNKSKNFYINQCLADFQNKTNTINKAAQARFSATYLQWKTIIKEHRKCQFPIMAEYTKIAITKLGQNI